MNMSNEFNKEMKGNTDKISPELNESEKKSPKIKKKVTFSGKNERFIYHNQPTPLQQNLEMPKQPKTKINNPDFYKNLPTEYFNKYNKIELYPINFNFEQRKTKKQKNSTEGQLFKGMREKQIYIMRQASPELSSIDNPIDRLAFLTEHIKFNHCSSSEKRSLLECFQQHHKAFQIPGDKFEHTNAGIHKIELKPGSNPLYIRQFRIPDMHKIELQEQINDLEAKGIISKSQSPWNSPVFLVPKKDDESGKKQYRMVVDYRALNKVIQPTSYPIPLIDEIVDQMHGCKIFSVKDLTSAFLQIPLDEKSRQYTSFSTTHNKYCFNSAPFGLSSSPYAWLRVIQTVLNGLISHNVMVYMDDIIIFSQNLEEHIFTIGQVLKRLVDHKLKLKVEISKFLQSQVHYVTV